MSETRKTRLSIESLENREVPATLTRNWVAIDPQPEPPAHLPAVQILFPVFTTGTAGKAGILLPSLNSGISPAGYAIPPFAIAGGLGGIRVG